MKILVIVSYIRQILGAKYNLFDNGRAYARGF